MFKLSGKKALVTGATGGIGSAIAQALISQGAQLVLSATKEEKLQQLANKLSIDNGSDIKYIVCDLFIT
jgi:3-oxoacyl-[acyl-carrier protein] reductase